MKKHMVMFYIEHDHDINATQTIFGVTFYTRDKVKHESSSEDLVLHSTTDSDYDIFLEDNDEREKD